jgi:uncharacterized OB-fold protein
VFILRGPMVETDSTKFDGVSCQHCGRFAHFPLTECPGCGAPLIQG